MRKLVSVIIANYNKEKYLKECINSVLSQSYPNIEIVIVDDHSADSSRKIIKEYQSNFLNVKAVLLEKNGGVSHARNIGVRESSGYYITMLDSDDFYYNPQKIENEVNLLENHNGEGLAYSYRQVVDANSTLLYRDRRNIDRYTSGMLFYQFMTEKDAFAFVQRDYVLPRAYIIEAGGYNEQESYYEDFDLLLRLTSKYPMYYTGEDGTAYRFIGLGLSVSNRKKDARQFRVPQQIRKRYMNLLPQNQRKRVTLIWYKENIRLEIRILLRKLKRLIKGIAKCTIQ